MHPIKWTKPHSKIYLQKAASKAYKKPPFYQSSTKMGLQRRWALSKRISSFNNFLWIVFEIPKWNYQHPKILTFFLPQVFVMNFMSPTYAQNVFVIPVSKKFKPLVNDDFMNKEISQSIKWNTYSNIKSKIIKHQTRHIAITAWHSKNEEETIVLFKKTRICLMMIFVQIP